MWRRWGKTEWTWLKIMYVKGITTGINDKFSEIFNCKNYVYALFSILSRYITSVIYFINGFERLLFKSEFYMLVRLSVKTLFCFVFYFVFFCFLLFFTSYSTVIVNSNNRILSFRVCFYWNVFSRRNKIYELLINITHSVKYIFLFFIMVI